MLCFVDNKAQFDILKPFPALFYLQSTVTLTHTGEQIEINNYCNDSSVVE
jgi:hypothetical protein